MTVYVDELTIYFGNGNRNGSWCHMWCDGELSELHKMADAIGLRRAWFQNHPAHPHYDLRPKYRRLAIEHGAVSVTAFELIQLIRQKGVNTKTP